MRFRLAVVSPDEILSPKVLDSMTHRVSNGAGPAAAPASGCGARGARWQVGWDASGWGIGGRRRLTGHRLGPGTADFYKHAQRTVCGAAIYSDANRQRGEPTGLLW